MALSTFEALRQLLLRLAYGEIEGPSSNLLLHSVASIPM